MYVHACAHEGAQTFIFIVYCVLLLIGLLISQELLPSRGLPWDWSSCERNRRSILKSNSPASKVWFGIQSSEPLCDCGFRSFSPSSFLKPVSPQINVHWATTLIPHTECIKLWGRGMLSYFIVSLAHIRTRGANDRTGRTIISHDMISNVKRKTAVPVFSDQNLIGQSAHWL